MTICFFGNYIADYPRVAVMRNGLKENGVEVLECQTRERGLKKYLALWREHRKIKNKYDLMLVMMGGQTLVWFAKFLTRKKVVFDAFSSLYLTNIDDRQLASKNSLKARIWAYWDWLPCQLADLVLLDTKAQIDYFIKKYKIEENKFIRIFASAVDEIFYPRPETENANKKFIIHWHGYIVPFYGLETIIKAAKILEKENLEFRITTRFNSEYEKIKKLVAELGLKNVTFFSETTRQELAKNINQADACLGVFGNNKKAQIVIPNKIVEAIACAKPVITGRQKVLEELFVGGESIMMCESEDPRDLAEKILKLKNNHELKRKIGQSGYQIYLKKLKPKVLIKENLLSVITNN
jgi:glycosyltransferase involved in cell wall biosynthesis